MYRPTLILLILCCALAVPAAFGQMFWNCAARFDTLGDTHLLVSPAADLNITGSFTLEAWVRPRGYHLAQTIIQKRTGSNAEGYTLYMMNNGRIALRTNTLTRVWSTDTLALNTWTHVAGVYSSTSNLFSIYIDGVLDTSATIASAAPAASADSLRIGGGFNGPFLGDMDNICIWDRALSAAEVKQYMSTALGQTSGVYDGLVLSIPFQKIYSSGTHFSLTDHTPAGHTIANHGVTAVDMSSAPSTYSSYNEAAAFDGANSYFSGPDNAAVSPTTAITLEAWIYPTDSTNSQVIISKGGGGSAATDSYRMLLTLDSTIVRAGINHQFVSSTARALKGRWTHAAFTYLASTGAYAFYVNGKPAGSGILPAGAIGDNADSLYIGGAPALTDFHGYIDEVRIANYVKTAAEIRQFLYQSIDQGNEPNSGSTNVVYSFEGDGLDNAMDGGPRLVCNAKARFSHPYQSAKCPIAPTLRVDGVAFPTGFHMKTTARVIPVWGNIIPDTIVIAENLTITDVNVFVALNHVAEHDVSIRVFSPDGFGAQLYYEQWPLFQGGGIITVFDDQADSAISGKRYATFSPHIQSNIPIQSYFTGKSTAGTWRLQVSDMLGGDVDEGMVYAWGIQFNDQTLVGVGETATLPERVSLDQNYPNPFNPVTQISYALPAAMPVQLVVYDLLGREVAVLENGVRDAGKHTVQFTASGVASGAYFYRLRAGSSVETRKLMIVR